MNWSSWVWALESEGAVRDRISLGVKILRWPTLALLVLVAPSLAATGLLQSTQNGRIGSSMRDATWEPQVHSW